MTVFKVFRGNSLEVLLRSFPLEIVHQTWHFWLQKSNISFTVMSASHLSLDKAGQGWAQKAPPLCIWPKLQRWTTPGPTSQIHWQVPPKDPKIELCYCYTKPPKLMISSFVLFSSKTYYHFFQFHSPRHYKSARTPLQKCLILIYANKSINC